MPRHCLTIVICFASLWIGSPRSQADELPRAIAEVKHEGPVDFEKEVLPILRKNCVACHNKTDAESDLSLETLQAILDGGASGPAVMAGKPLESLLLVRAAGGGDGIMPPKKNKAAAKELTAQEMGLIKLWIEQGATGSLTGAASGIEWQALSADVKPIYAVALSPDAQFVACGRANQVFVYHVPTQRLVGRLTDPELLAAGVYKQPGMADLDIVQSLAFSADGSLLATGGYRTAKLWQRPHDVRAATFDQAAKDAQSLATSRDGRWLAIGNQQGKIQLFDIASGKPVKTIEGHEGAVTALAFAADGATLLSGSADKSVRAWKIPEGQAVGRIDTPQPVSAVALLDGGKLWASAGGDNDIHLWTPPAGETAGVETAKLTGHAKPVVSMATIAASPMQLLSGSADGQMIQWDAAAKKQIRAFKHSAELTTVAARDDGKRFVSAGVDGIAKLWNADDGQSVADLKHEYVASIELVELQRDAARAKSLLETEKKAVETAEKAIKTEETNVKTAQTSLEKAVKTHDEQKAVFEKAKAAHDEATKNATAADAAKKANDDARAEADKTFTDAETALKTADAELAAATAAAKDKEDKPLAAAVETAMAKQKTATDALTAARDKKAELDKQMRPLADATKKPAAELQKTTRTFTDVEKSHKTAEIAHSSAERALASAQAALKKAGERLVELKASLVEDEKSLTAADKRLADATQAANAAIKPLRAVAFSPDGKLLATAGDDELVHTWSTDVGRPTDTLHGHKGAVKALAFVDDVRLVSAGADAQAIVWSTLPEWTWLRTIGQGAGGLADRVTALDFSPDDKLLATGGGAPSRDGELKIWNVADGSLLHEVADAHSDTVLGVAFSPDGKNLASCGADKFVKVHDVASGKFVRSFEGHTHHVLGVSWLADGLTLVSGGADNVIKVWEFQSGDQKRTIQGFKKEVTSIHPLGDTAIVLATAGDPTVKLENTADGQAPRTFAGATDFIYAGAVSYDGKLVAAGGEDSVLRLWDGTNGATLFNFDSPAVVKTGEQQAAK